MKYFIIFISICFSLQLSAQSTYPDMVLLKNGSMLRCKILEYKLNDVIKLEIQGGSVLVYQSDEVAEIKKEYNFKGNEVEKTLLKHSYSDELYFAFYMNIIGGYIERNSLTGGALDYPTIGIGTKFSMGKSVNRHLMLGGGIAWARMDNYFMYSSHLPIFAEVRGDILKKNNSLYYSLGLGYNFVVQRKSVSWSGCIMTDANGGFFVNPAIGLRFASIYKTHFCIEFNYAIHSAGYSFTGRNGELIGPTKNLFIRPTLSFGFLF